MLQLHKNGGGFGHGGQQRPRDEKTANADDDGTTESRSLVLFSSSLESARQDRSTSLRRSVGHRGIMERERARELEIELETGREMGKDNENSGSSSNTTTTPHLSRSNSSRSSAATVINTQASQHPHHHPQLFSPVHARGIPDATTATRPDQGSPPASFNHPQPIQIPSTANWHLSSSPQSTTEYPSVFSPSSPPGLSNGLSTSPYSVFSAPSSRPSHNGDLFPDFGSSPGTRINAAMATTGPYFRGIPDNYGGGSSASNIGGGGTGATGATSGEGVGTRASEGIMNGNEGLEYHHPLRHPSLIGPGGRMRSTSLSTSPQYKLWNYGTPEMPRGNANLPYVPPEVLQQQIRMSPTIASSRHYPPHGQDINDRGVRAHHLPRAEKLPPTGYALVASIISENGGRGSCLKGRQRRGHGYTSSVLDGPRDSLEGPTQRWNGNRMCRGDGGGEEKEEEKEEKEKKLAENEGGEDNGETKGSERIKQGSAKKDPKPEKIKTADNGSDDGEIRPIYRRFETLNHRILLHLQDELAELEEQLRRLDVTDTQKRMQTSPIQPASRRVEALEGGDLQWKKTDLLGMIWFKMERYNQVLSTFHQMQRLTRPSKSEVNAYRTFLTANKPIADKEARFLDQLDDLVSLTRRPAVLRSPLTDSESGSRNKDEDENEGDDDKDDDNTGSVSVSEDEWRGLMPWRATHRNRAAINTTTGQPTAPLIKPTEKRQATAAPTIPPTLVTANTPLAMVFLLAVVMTLLPPLVFISMPNLTSRIEVAVAATAVFGVVGGLTDGHARWWACAAVYGVVMTALASVIRKVVETT